MSLLLLTGTMAHDFGFKLRFLPARITDTRFTVSPPSFDGAAVAKPLDYNLFCSATEVVLVIFDFI